MVFEIKETSKYLFRLSLLCLKTEHAYHLSKIQSKVYLNSETIH